MPGHLPFGPEAGAIKTFQIVPGVSTLAGGGVVLGGRDSSKNEVDSITFYPDSFFGTFSLYDEMGDYMNRLLEPMFPDQVDASGNTQALEMTLEEVNEAIDLINKTNQFNKDYIATTKNLDPRIAAY